MNSVDRRRVTSIDAWISTLPSAAWRVSTALLDVWITRSKSSGSTSKSPISLLLLLAPFDLTKKKKKKKTFVVQDAIEDSVESHGRHTIRCLIVQEEFIGYIAEHPNDEKEVEGIDMHQQRYPWEGSDMAYLYYESSFAQLLSMELTLEIDDVIFHVPNANASSNVDSQL
ncbi:hypothetical protein F2Q69_00020788 [Brassica cretica]|uniref:Uncharacterized protein n=1 Tax=Brassica cretica TaxID=69181 RepID=A0A8S9Q679_BRACR|nr:hypothetical protein F2Q69_00020788 [Brassica cretica]